MDRHPKWTPVEPGTVIPAGQPYANVKRQGHPRDWTVEVDGAVLVDSSWKPPLVLPTEPTWGIAVTSSGYVGAADWYLHETEAQLRSGDNCTRLLQTDVLDFIALTDEQIAQIEAAR